MREILFRGKDAEIGNWYIGDIFHSSMDVDTVRIHDYINRANVKIIPETLGQYTGLTDKNGKKIFEGDIVRMERGLMLNGEYAYCEVCKVIYDHCCFFVAFPDGCRRTRLYREDDTERYEIIGNIHDNPELLKGE